LYASCGGGKCCGLWRPLHGPSAGGSSAAHNESCFVKFVVVVAATPMEDDEVQEAGTDGAGRVALRDAVDDVRAAWLTTTIDASHKPMFKRCQTSGVVLSVNKCAMYHLMHGVGETPGSGERYEAALNKLCGTTGVWAGRTGDIRARVRDWGGRSQLRVNGFPKGLQVDGERYLPVPIPVRLETLTAMLMASRAETTAERAKVTETEAKLAAAMTVAAGSSCKLEKRKMICANGREHEAYSSEANDLLAEIMVGRCMLTPGFRS
jgi:hypothetical protein